MIEIRHAHFPDDVELVRELFREYAAGLGVDLCFQGFQEELAGMPGKYAEPKGCVLLAFDGATALGCVALRPLGERDGEMKRLYVRVAARGKNLGTMLVKQVCDEARAAGYARICLDTLPAMGAAQKIYAEMGFGEIEAYVFNPVEGVRYLGLRLD